MEISLAAEKIGEIGGFPVTNSMIAAWFIAFFLIVVGFFVGRNVKEIPGKVQNFFEMIFEAVLGVVESITGDRKQAFFFFPFITTFFIFIILNNWLGLLPGFGSIGFYEEHHGKEVLVPFLRGGNADLNMTFALAIISVVLTQVVGILATGYRYGAKYLSFKDPISFFVGILETVSEVAKILSFAFRLFGNIFAGEVLLLVVMSLVPLFIPLPFLFLEIFVGFVQALVFAMLTLVNMKIATMVHEAHGSH